MNDEVDDHIDDDDHGDQAEPVDEAPEDALDDGWDADDQPDDAPAADIDDEQDLVKPGPLPASAYGRWRQRQSTRISKWDRPPEPHDWRYFVGGLGKTLITIGLLMFGFVGYQLWGTGIETARAQNKLENQFEQLVEENAGNSSPPTTTTVPATTLPGTIPGTTAAPATTQPAAPATTEPVIVASTIPTTVEQELPEVERGRPLFRLEIPKIDKDLIVVPGVSLDDLQQGPGHYPDTPLPGQLGNSAIAGHRTTWGEPFRHIDQLDPGDEIIVTLLNGDRYVYLVASTEIVDPGDYHVVSTTDPTVAELTLTSCHPVFTARQRIVVHAFLKPAESAPVGTPTFYDLGADGAEEDTGDPSVEPGATSNDATVSESASASASASDEESSAEVVTPDTSEHADAFGQGWFHDPDAWPQIALWGLALIVIAIAVRRISRHFRHDSVGIAAGIVPFVVCLYFFYQNVNRLLPPGL